MERTIHFIGAKCTKEEMFNSISKPSGLDKWWATKSEGIVELGGILYLTFKA